MSYLTEAFKALDALNEETFSVSDDGIKKLAEFETDDDLFDEITVFDADADDTEDLEDSYVGKVIVDCNVCHSKIYKDKSDVVIDEETQNANIDEECPYCYSTDGFKVIGEVAPMTTETEEKVEVEDDIEESCIRKRMKNESFKFDYSQKVTGLFNPESDDMEIVIDALSDLGLYAESDSRGDNEDNVHYYTNDGDEVYSQSLKDEFSDVKNLWKNAVKQNKTYKDLRKDISNYFYDITEYAELDESLNEATEMNEDKTYIDAHGGFGEPGEKITFTEIKKYWDDNSDTDPILQDYDSFEDWFKETKQNYLTEIDESLNEASTDRVQKLLSIIDNSFEVLEDAPINEDVLEEAKQIRLSSIPGVTRDPSNDFADDGNKFQAYLYKGVVPITYLRAGEDVYITIAFHHLEDINYDEYKEFPSYKNADEFNGVPVDTFNAEIFQKNLEDAYKDIVDFLGSVEDVDSAQLEDRITSINNACKEYEEKVKRYIQDNALKIMKLSDSQFRNLKNYVSNAGSRTADHIRNASSSSQRHFMSQDLESLKRQISNSWNFEYIEDILNTVQESLKESVDLLTRENTIASVLNRHMDELSEYTDATSMRNAIINILDKSEIADKDAVKKLKQVLFSKKSTAALLSTIATYMTGEKVAKVGKPIKEDITEKTIDELEDFINETKRRFPGSEAIYDGDTNTIKITLDEKTINEDLGTDIDEYQQWVDYDMKRYGKISDQTNKEIKEAGLQVVKDKYGDYQVIAGKYDESLKESVKDVTITTDDSKTTMTSEDDGKVTVTTEPVEDHKEDEVIEPLTDETEAEIVANDGEEDIDIEDFDEESFDELGEGYFKKVYENVNSFKTANVSTKDNKVIVEGIVTFDNNIKKSTKFIFESFSKKNDKYRMIGENVNITKGNKAFSLIGSIKDKKFLSESLNYNYRTKNNIGKSTRCLGTVRRG